MHKRHIELANYGVLINQPVDSFNFLQKIKSKKLKILYLKSMIFLDISSWKKKKTRKKELYLRHKPLK